MLLHILGIVTLIVNINFGFNEPLIVSNYPEKITGPGHIIQHTIKHDRLRLMYYHKNISKDTLFVHLDLENTSSKNVITHVTNGISGPVNDEVFAGHESTKRFFNKIFKNNFETITLKPKQRKSIIVQKIKPELIVAGITSLYTSEKNSVKIHLNIIDHNYATLSLLNEQEGSVQFNHGYFDDSLIKQTINFDCKQLIKEIAIGDAPFLNDQSNEIRLDGNYAVWYQINLHLTNSENTFKDVNLLFSPKGGVARGLFLINNDIIETGLQKSMTANKVENIYKITVPPLEKKVVKILTMPQSGSYYPVHLILNTEAS